MSRHSMDKEALACLASIRRMKARIEEGEKNIDVTVPVALAHGAPWSAIGTALGVSAQAAWEKYRAPAAPRPLPGQGGLWEDPPV